MSSIFCMYHYLFLLLFSLLTIIVSGGIQCLSLPQTSSNTLIEHDSQTANGYEKISVREPQGSYIYLDWAESSTPCSVLSCLSSERNAFAVHTHIYMYICTFFLIHFFFGFPVVFFFKH